MKHRQKKQLKSKIKQLKRKIRILETPVPTPKPNFSTFQNYDIYGTDEFMKAALRANKKGY